MTPMSLTVSGIGVRLWPGRALDWPEGQTLFVADPHFGKAAAFRSVGIAAPDATRVDLDRIERLMRLAGARRLVVLGDFFHARAGVTASTLGALEEWRARCRAVEVVVIRGNHDLGAGDPPRGLGVRSCPDPFRLGPWVCRHEPVADARGPVLAGHVHPGRVLRDRRGGVLRVACFVVGERMVVLPGFGSFTGTKEYAGRVGDRFFAVSEQTIIPLNGGEQGLV